MSVVSSWSSKASRRWALCRPESRQCRVWPGVPPGPGGSPRYSLLCSESSGAPTGSLSEPSQNIWVMERLRDLALVILNWYLLLLLVGRLACCFRPWGLLSGDGGVGRIWRGRKFWLICQLLISSASSYHTVFLRQIRINYLPHHQILNISTERILVTKLNI